MKTLYTLKQLLPDAINIDKWLSRFSQLPTTALINENLVAELLVSMKGEDGMLAFCDIMEQLCDDRASITFITSIRNGMYVHCNSYVLSLYTNAHIILYWNLKP